MSNFYERYKSNPGGCNDLATGRMLRAGRHQERRKINRTDNFSRFRDVSSSPARPAPKKTTLDPIARLQKWKLEKALKKQMEQQRKKPVFKVGVVHHHFYSPTMNDKINSKSIPCHTRGARKVKTQSSPPKRISRATQKRLEAKSAAVTPAVLAPQDPEISKRASSMQATLADPRNSASTLASHTPPNSDTLAPAMFSPYITMSRGKDSARRERRSKMGIGPSPLDEIPTKETVMRNLNISVEEEERTAQYFKHILQREIDRLREVCAKWEKIMDDPELTEDARYLINQAVGQTNLLVEKKFERFRRLVEDCETGKGEMLVQCRDLQGFWDMMYMEVKDCDRRFQKLETSRDKNWLEDEVVVRTKKPVGRKKGATTKAPIDAKSSARSWILARKKKMLEEANEDVVLFGANGDSRRPSSGATTQTTSGDEISARRSLKKSPTPRKTPTSVLKKVQLAETAKNARSPLAAMKISRMYKTPEVRSDESISYVNSDQTPGKGILKKSETTSDASARPKSSRKVDFHDDVESNVERSIEDLENSIDLGRALARIDSYDSDASDDVFEPTDHAENIVTDRRRVEQRLDFEDESFGETVDSDVELNVPAEAKKFDIPTLNIVEATPIARNTKTNETIDEESQPEENPSRVLRNREVPINTPNKSKRRSTKSGKKPTVDSSAKENDDPQVEEQKLKVSESRKNVESDSGNEGTIGRRKSTRKSVRFNAYDCTGCADSYKPVHPMTPHSRKNRKISLLGDDSRQSIVPEINGDLMSFDSPSTTVVPRRVRRGSEMGGKTPKR